MGSAIGAIPGRPGRLVSRLAVCAGEDHRRPAGDALRRFYKLVPDFAQRFPAGAPSLRRCRRLEVSADVTIEGT
jgi:hypothetical protein